LNPGIKGDLELPDDEVKANLAAGKPFVIRMKVPDSGTCVIQDKLRGTIEIDWAQVDCQILLKSDGMPTYHLANVVDDHLMAITHVIRGEEWINSAPKHQLLYAYFGWEMPELCHMPLLRNPDKSKLSKRKNPTSINFYERMGFLPEAVLNYLGRMGWSMPDEREKFTLDEMVASFDISRVSLGGPIFDMEKLRWLNGLWIRENLDHGAFVNQVSQWIARNPEWKKLIPLVQSRIDTFSDIAPMANFLFAGMLPLTEADFEHKKLEAGQVKRVLQFTLWKLEALRDWQKDSIFAEVKSLCQAMELKMGDFMFPIFVAIAGTPNSWSVMDSMAAMGPDMCRARLRNALDTLGGFSKKETKKVEKEFLKMLDSEGGSQ
ncbi:MAG: glutamate--tRNA ligase, partial [Pseudomonadales bacterium]|nr:glutamate--tRNA ligase [Pseudomonadales bacterium]